MPVDHSLGRAWLHSRMQQVQALLWLHTCFLISEPSSTTPWPGLSSMCRPFPFPWAPHHKVPSVHLDISKEIFKTSQTQLWPSDLVFPQNTHLWPTCHCLSRCTSHKPGCLNISLSLIPQTQRITKSCHNTSQTSRDCFHFFSISYARTLSQATGSSFICCRNFSVSSSPLLPFANPLSTFQSESTVSEYTNLMAVSLHDPSRTC